MYLFAGLSVGIVLVYVCINVYRGRERGSICRDEYTMSSRRAELLVPVSRDSFEFLAKVLGFLCTSKWKRKRRRSADSSSRSSSSSSSSWNKGLRRRVARKVQTEYHVPGISAPSTIRHRRDVE